MKIKDYSCRFPSIQSQRMNDALPQQAHGSATAQASLDNSPKKSNESHHRWTSNVKENGGGTSPDRAKLASTGDTLREKGRAGRTVAQH